MFRAFFILEKFINIAIDYIIVNSVDSNHQIHY